jgi:DNA (cytosine-5)-methyltransferase 1
MERLTHLSLFTGIGGIDLAAEAAGFETVCQCERAAYPLAVLERHWPETPRFTDIEKLTKEVFVEKTGLETVTLISGGFPCQPFSQAGERRGFADERYLWPEMHRVIRELRPRWVLGENVAGFVNMGLHKTVSDLEKAGYCVRTFVIPACAVGARHERKRTFIVGADTSDPRCLRHKNRGAKNRRVRNTGWGDTQTGEKRLGLDAETVRRGGVPHAGRAEGRGTQPPLVGVADGIPAEMDGGLIWEAEPAGVPRMIIHEKNWANRMKALGNAVVPQQVYPILRYIAEIERGDVS